MEAAQGPGPIPPPPR